MSTFTTTIRTKSELRSMIKSGESIGLTKRDVARVPRDGIIRVVNPPYAPRSWSADVMLENGQYVDME